MSWKKLSLLAPAIACAASAFGQGMFGFMGGAGYTIGNKGYVTPTVEGYYLAKLSHHFYAGGSISFQRYSLQKDFNVDESTAPFWDPISIRQKSNYLYLCAKADIGIGYRNLYHVHVAAGPGFYAGGGQWTKERTPFYTSAFGSFGSVISDVNTTYNIKDVIGRVTVGISERIPTMGYWNIMLSQEFTLLPGSLTKSGDNINANYFAFTVGIMHKYPQVRMEY
jgi:hypothetical protein